MDNFSNINGYELVPPRNEGDSLRNLRSRGYPSSMEEYVKRIRGKIVELKPQNLIMNSSIPIDFSKDIRETSNKGWERDLVNGVVGIYNTLKSDKKSWPSVDVIEKDEFDNQNRPVRAVNGIQFALPNNGLNGFFQKDTRVKSTQFSGLVNGLNNMFGDNNFQGALNTPFGKISGTYDGDSIYGTLSTPVNENYYYRALRNLLDRGQL